MIWLIMLENVNIFDIIRQIHLCIILNHYDSLNSFTPITPKHLNFCYVKRVVFLSFTSFKCTILEQLSPYIYNGRYEINL